MYSFVSLCTIVNYHIRKLVGSRLSPFFLRSWSQDCHCHCQPQRSSSLVYVVCTTRALRCIVFQCILSPLLTSDPKIVAGSPNFSWLISLLYIAVLIYTALCYILNFNFLFLRSLIFSLALWSFSWLLIPRLSPQYQGNPNVPWLILQLQQYCNVLCCNLQCVTFCILTSFFAIHPIFSSQDSSADFTARLLHCIAIDAFWGASWYTDCHCNPNIPKIIVELYHYHCIELNCILAYFVCIISAVCLSVLKCVGFSWTSSKLCSCAGMATPATGRPIRWPLTLEYHHNYI